MIKYRCVHDFSHYKKGDETESLPEGAGSHFVRVSVPDLVQEAPPKPTTSPVKPNRVREETA